MKRLTLIRHAKAEGRCAEQDDFDRALKRRGQKDAVLMGQRLLERSARPDKIISSTARRALHTARLIATEIGYPHDNIGEEPGLYEAPEQRLLTAINGFDDSWQHVMLFGHNPGLTRLAEQLSHYDLGHLPTCGIFCIDFDTHEWMVVCEGLGDRIYYEYPKKAE